MDPKVIGLCALFLGIERTASIFSETPEKVEAFISLVKHENTPFLCKVRKIIKNIINSLGIEQAKKTFKLEDDILNIIARCDFNETTEKIAQKSELEQRVVALYGKKIPMKKIIALYDLPNFSLVQSWGSWTRCNSGNGEKYRKRKEEIKLMLDSGSSLEETGYFFGLSEQKLKNELGLTPRTSVFFTRKEILNILDAFCRHKNQSKIINEFGCNLECITSWFENFQNNHALNYNRAVESDDEADSVTKRKAIEDFYLTKSHVHASETLNFEEQTLSRWLAEFEKNTLRIFGGVGKFNKLFS